MLTTSRQLRFSYLRRLMILPIATMIFCSLAFVVNENHSFANVINPADTIPPPPPPAPSAQFKPDTLPNNEEVFTFVEQPPSFPGGDPALAKFLNQNIRYPHTAVEKEKSGTIFVSFVVTKDGSVKNVKTVGAKKGYGLEEEAVRVVKLMPKWKPGKQNNKLVNVQFNLPIRFTLQEAKPEKKAPKVGKDGVYTYADVMPKFPGGDEGLARYLSTSIRYPADATKLGIMGNVLVSFTLDTEGNIKDVRAVNKPVLGGGLEEEGIRVVKAMPKWRPAMDGGKTVPIRFAVPIRFQLQH